MARYIAFIHKDVDSDYGISFPDFHGCVSAGSTVAEARALGSQALHFHMDAMVESGQAIPDPSDIDEAMLDEGAKGVFLITDVEVIPPAKTVRINITIREDQLSMVDSYAQRAGISRSEFLVQSAVNAARTGEVKTVRSTEISKDVAIKDAGSALGQLVYKTPVTSKLPQRPVDPA